jgi:hypothetical protein
MNRCQIFQTVALGAIAAGAASLSATSQGVANTVSSAERKSFIAAKDGTKLHVRVSSPT